MYSPSPYCKRKMNSTVEAGAITVRYVDLERLCVNCDPKEAIEGRLIPGLSLEPPLPATPARVVTTHDGVIFRTVLL